MIIIKDREFENKIEEMDELWKEIVKRNPGIEKISDEIEAKYNPIYAVNISAFEKIMHGEAKCPFCEHLLTINEIVGATDKYNNSNRICIALCCNNCLHIVYIIEDIYIDVDLEDPVNVKDKKSCPICMTSFAKRKGAVYSKVGIKSNIDRIDDIFSVLSVECQNCHRTVEILKLLHPG